MPTRIIVAGLAVAVSWSPAAAYAAQGDLDQSFSRNGIRTVARPEVAKGLAIQPTGGIVVAGFEDPPGLYRHFASVTRYLPSGALDHSFGEDGELILPPNAGAPDGPSASTAAGVVVAPDGSIIVAGSHQFGDAESSGMIARLRPDGSLDPTFGSNGIATVADFAGGASAVALDGQGRVVVAGVGGVLRLLSDGSLDPQFSDDGRVDSLPIRPRVLDLAPDGSIVVGGENDFDPTEAQLPPRLGIAQLKADGELDRDFGQGGIVGFELEADHQAIHSIAVDAGGNLLVGTEGCITDLFGGGGGCADSVRRFTPRGELDPSFAEGGVLADQVGAQVLLDHRARILVGGSRSPHPGLGLGFAVTRLLAAGPVPDPDFARRGTAFAYDRLRGGGATQLALEPGKAITLLGDVGYGDARLLRFELEPGRGDADADRRGDRRDPCRHFYARARTGCPRVPRGANLMPRGEQGLQLNLHAQLGVCEQDEPVTFMRKRRAGDEVFARTRQPNRRYHRSVPDGVYYAIAPRHLERGAGFCERARTRSVLVR